MATDGSVRRSGVGNVLKDCLPCGEARVGTPGIQQTVVERLVREGGTRNENYDKRAVPTHTILADLP